MRPIASALVALTLLSGCYNVHVRTTAEPAQGDERATTLHFINGLTPGEVEARDCSRGIADVRFQLPVWGVLLNAITFGLVGAVETTYTCVKGSKRSSEGPARDATTPVADAGMTTAPGAGTVAP